MPAAAVIPAPIVYIKVAAVKKLVVGFRNARSQSPSLGACSTSASYLPVTRDRSSRVGYEVPDRLL